MWDIGIADNGILYAGAFLGNFSFLLAVVIGIIATFFVFRSARRLGGGLFGRVLNYVGIGMLLIAVGTISVIFEPWFSDLWVQLAHTVFFATGFIFLGFGADKLLKGINAN